jgi:hypothetical protein
MTTEMNSAPLRTIDMDKVRQELEAYEAKRWKS